MLLIILTALSTALCTACLACAMIAYRAASDLVRDRKVIRDADVRLTDLERGQIALGQSLARMNGRHGALVARVNRLDTVEGTDFAADVEDANANDEHREAEREKLRALLATKSQH